MSLEIVESRGKPVPYNLFLKIVNEIVPTIMDSSVPIFKRYALAWSWYKFLCIAYRGCPEGVPANTRQWDSTTLEKIAEKLIEYANYIIHEYLSPGLSSQTAKKLIEKHRKDLLF